MGTRSTTIIMDGNKELVRIYRQMDGYPEGHGIQLAQLCNRQMVNGFGLGMSAETHANGMGCLAAQIIAGLKTEIGYIYIEPCNEEISEWVEYVYVVRGREGSKPTIECSTQTGPFPFNMQAEDKHVFTGTVDEWLTKFAPQPKAKKPAKKSNVEPA